MSRTVHSLHAVGRSHSSRSSDENSARIDVHA